MIKVYFETKHSAELVAVFESDEIYNLCVPALEKEAEKRGMILTESVEENIEDFEIDNFLARDKAKEVLLKIEELEDVLIKFGIYDTSEISLKDLEEELRESIIKFEKSKL